jgi:tRNA/rRNA methyltransferase
MEIFFVLVQPARPENVGAAARAIKTMGFSELRLVNPAYEDADRALRVAHGSREILERAGIFSSLEEAVADADFVIGTTAKRRMVKHDYVPSTALVEELRRKGDTVYRVAVVFGREESGLSNEELARCTVVSRIPMRRLYPSLNLGQAVMIYAYTLSPLAVGGFASKKIGRDPESLAALLSKAEAILGSLGIAANPLVYNRMIERLTAMGQDDIHLMHSFCNKLLERLKCEESAATGKTDA